MKIYPNPADSYVHLEYAGFSKDARVQLFDQLGHLLLTSSLCALDEYKIEVSARPESVYLARVTDKDAMWGNKLVILK